MRANKCKYCVFCRKVRNYKTCAAFISFPNLLVVNLARNVDTVKCGKKVSLSRYVQIKGKDCSDLDAMYELVSVVVHLGEFEFEFEFISPNKNSRKKQNAK